MLVQRWFTVEVPAWRNDRVDSSHETREQAVAAARALAPTCSDAVQVYAHQRIELPFGWCLERATRLKVW